MKMNYSAGRIRVLKQWRILKESMCANLPFETGQELLSRFALENVLSQNCHLKSPGLFWSAPPAHIRKQMKASPLARGGLGLRAVVGRSRTNLRFQPKLVFADRFPSFTTDQLLIHIFLLFLIVPFKLRAFRQLDPHTFKINCSVIFFPSEFKLISKDSQWICALEICVENLHCNHICGKIK